MKAIEMKKDVYWVGGIDWDLRSFHGYLTQRGSTYNAYLIIDEKITLIDTVKHYLADELVERIAHVVDPAKIDYVISNHVEMDHSGSLPKILELAPNATVITSAPRGEFGLKVHYNPDWTFQPVKTGDTLNIGKRRRSFGAQREGPSDGWAVWRQPGFGGGLASTSQRSRTDEEALQLTGTAGAARGRRSADPVNR